MVNEARFAFLQVRYFRTPQNGSFDPSTIVPGLTSPLEGTYGTSTTVTVPFSERNNPNFTGCIDET